MRRIHIDFMGNRRWLFALSGVLITISIAAILVRGLSFGIEFQGGTVMNFGGTKAITEPQMRDALEAEGMEASEVQPVEGGGFIIRSAEASAAVASDAAASIGKKFGISEGDINVTTIGPGWGKSITNAAVLALVLALVAIVAYISLRFEYKMSITAVIALVHDVLITLGIYALAGREITPNTVAALLSVLGYSLYDTIVVFHRIRENSQHLVKQSFMEMANDSINQVLVRSINTSLVSVIPVAMLMFFGGETLKDFAFALLIGLLSGAYSSVGVAAPLYAMWKEREPKYQALAKRYAAK